MLDKQDNQVIENEAMLNNVNGGAAPVVDNTEMMDFSVSVAKKPRFEPLNIYHDLCIGTLEKVEVTYREVPAVNAKGEESTYEFAGKTIPELKFTFNNYKLAGVDEIDREFVKTYSPIGWDDEADDTKKDNIKLVYDGMNTQLMHLVQFFTGITKDPARPLIPKINPALPTDVRIKAFDNFFTGFATWFNSAKKGKEIFKDVNAKSIVLTIKLIAVTKSGNGGKQFKILDFPRYVQEGFLEVFRGIKQIPGIKLKPGESVKLEKVELTPNEGQGSADHSTVNVDDLSPEMKKMMGIED